MVRSLLAGAAAVWFFFNALTFIPAMGAFHNDGAPGGIDGDPGAVAVTWAARTLFGGLVLISLALIDWREVAEFFGPITSKPDDPKAINPASGRPAPPTDRIE